MKDTNGTNNVNLKNLNAMKMTNQLKTIGAVALAAIMTLASCSKDGENATPQTEDFSVILSFKNAAATRAEGEAAIDGTKIEIEDGYLCFVSATGLITDVYTISDAPTADKNILNSTRSATIQNVPASSTKVYMIANKGSLSTPPATGGNMPAYLNNSMVVADQSEYTTVTCVDEAGLTNVEAGKKAAAISLTTEVARIQVKGLEFEGFTGGKVTGIFINGFYPTMELDGDATGLQTSTDKAMYVAGSTVFTNALQSYVYDTFEKDIADNVTPSDVWGYNLFASATPQIIIKLTDVVAGGQTYAATQFITVNGFNDASTSTAIANLEGGMIYTIEAGSLVIKPEHLNPEPGVTPFSVDVTIAQAEWDETTVVPNL